MKNVFLKPRTIDGSPALIRDPRSRKPLAAEGEWKPRDQFWMRRIIQNDVVDATEEQLKAQAAPAEAAKAPPSPGPSTMPVPSKK